MDDDILAVIPTAGPNLAQAGGQEERHLLTGQTGWNPDNNLPVWDEFSLGGFFSLSGFAFRELRGEYMGVVRAGYYRNVRGSMKLGGWVEGGNVWQTRDQYWDDVVPAFTAFFGTDTILGPLYVAWGWADEGRSTLYLSLGRTFAGERLN